MSRIPPEPAHVYMVLVVKVHTLIYEQCPLFLVSTALRQGSSKASEDECSIHATCRAARMLPASAAICPYEATRPSGMTDMMFRTLMVKAVATRNAPVLERL
jgi:hypothetical protein